MASDLWAGRGERLGRWSLALLYLWLSGFCAYRVFGPSEGPADGGLPLAVAWGAGSLLALGVAALLTFGFLSAERQVLLARLSLAGIFLLAAVPKILDPLGFAQDIDNYQLLPDLLVNLTAVMLPWIEAFAALALLSGFALDGAVLLVAAQLVVFLIALGQAWVRDLDIDCGCFGHGQGGRSVAKAFLEDWIFLGIAVSVLFQRMRRPPPD